MLTSKVINCQMSRKRTSRKYLTFYIGHTIKNLEKKNCSRENFLQEMVIRIFCVQVTVLGVYMTFNISTFEKYTI